MTMDKPPPQNDYISESYVIYHCHSPTELNKTESGCALCVTTTPNNMLYHHQQ